MKHFSLKTKRIILTTVAIAAAVVFVLFSRFETPAEHDKRVQKEHEGNIVILDDNTNQEAVNPSVTMPPASDNVTLSPAGKPTLTDVITKPATPEITISGNDIIRPSITENVTVTSAPSITSVQTVTSKPTPTKELVVATPTATLAPQNTITKAPTPTPLAITPTKAQTPEEKEYVYVSFSITCKDVLNNENLNTKSEIPENGVIFSGQLKVVKGSSVLEALEAVCKEKNIQYTNLSTGYGGYISSINNLAEKECGRYSGWKYYVNGKTPNTSCDKFKITEDAEIEWAYATTF